MLKATAKGNVMASPCLVYSCLMTPMSGYPADNSTVTVTPIAGISAKINSKKRNIEIMP